MKRSRILVAAAALGLTVACPRLARADSAVELEAAARIGAASSPGWIANPYALGFGGRAGASFYGFYGGISALYYLGGSGGESGFHTVLVGLEAGYTFKLPHLRLRPQVGVGGGTFMQEASDGALNPPITTTVGNVYVEPGLVVLFPVGPIFLGADANALLLPRFTLATPGATARTYASFSAHGQIGVFF